MALPSTKNEELDQQQYLGGGEAANDPSYHKRGRIRAVKVEHNVASGDSSPSTERRQTVTGKKPDITASKSADYQPEQPHQSIDQKFSGSYAKQGLQPTQLNDRPPADKLNKDNQTKQSNIRASKVEYSKPRIINTGLKGARRAKKKTEVEMKARLKEDQKKARLINSFIRSWAGYLCSTFQFGFATLNIIFFGLAAALASYTTSNPEDGFFATVGKGLLSIASGGVKGLVSFYDYIMGTNYLALTNPASLWMITQMIIFCYAIFVLVLIYLQYRLFGFKPLSGNGAGFKIGALLLALIGYSLPLFNFFPWFLVWIFAVGLRPK